LIDLSACRVTIIDFGFTRVLNPDEQARKANVEPCAYIAINHEMRKVKFMLNWKDSQAAEYKLARLRDAREAKDLAVRLADGAAQPFSLADLPEEPMSEEEKAVSSYRCNISD